LFILRAFTVFCPELDSFADLLGYDESHPEQFPRDDLIKLAGDDCKDLISASRKIRYNLAMKDSRKCDLRELVKKMAVLLEYVVDFQASSARGAAQMALAMCLARAPTLNLDEATAAILKDSNSGELLDACSGYDTHVASVYVTASFTKSFFPQMKLSKQSFRKNLMQRKNMSDLAMAASTPRPAPRKRRKTRPRVAVMPLHLWQRMRKNELFLWENKKNIASFGPFVSL
jgi:hypothetical protein